MNPYRHLLLQLYKLTGDSFKTERRQEVQQFHNELITVIQQMQNSNKYDQSVVNKKLNKLIEISQDYKQFYNSSLLEFVESMEIYGLEQYPYSQQQIKSSSTWQELTPIKQEVTMQVRPTQRSRASALKRSRDDSVSLQPVSQTVYQMNNSQTLKLSLQENELKPTKVTPVQASISPIQAPVLRSSSLPKSEPVQSQIKKPQIPQPFQVDESNIYAQQIQQQNVQINQLTIQLNQTSQQVEYLTKQLQSVQNELECVKELIQTNQQPLQIKTVPVVKDSLNVKELTPQNYLKQEPHVKQDFQIKELQIKELQKQENQQKDNNMMQNNNANQQGEVQILSASKCSDTLKENKPRKITLKKKETQVVESKFKLKVPEKHVYDLQQLLQQEFHTAQQFIALFNQKVQKDSIQEGTFAFVVKNTNENHSDVEKLNNRILDNIQEICIKLQIPFLQSDIFMKCFKRYLLVQNISQLKIISDAIGVKELERSVFVREMCDYVRKEWIEW
ncbi:Hypothetical_protein [Hexamita inflata]|uniref:Hypothetical_protein n=1 Tax=Hexamita inflata TaxID=28002 RepID=A0AA86RDG9_9EUKA|nr:Hypothetical protein HINF_LOCUS58837 [Hexamita inflata]